MHTNAVATLTLHLEAKLERKPDEIR
jgi:hypothetical protein